MVLEKLVELGCKEPYIIHALNSLLIKLDELNRNRSRSLMICSRV